MLFEEQLDISHTFGVLEHEEFDAKFKVHGGVKGAYTLRGRNFTFCAFSEHVDHSFTLIT